LLQHPDEIAFFNAAHVIVGCSTESADRVYFSSENAIKHLGDHHYMAFFDVDGKKIGEVQVEDCDDGEYRVRVDF